MSIANAPLDAARMANLAAIADHYIPAAHGMPSAAEVVDSARVEFVLRSRPDLAEPLIAALRPELGADVGERLAFLAEHEKAGLDALQLVIVGGYYTDKRVRELIGYPGQEAIEVRSWIVPEYIEEGLVDAVIARGPVWRDPSTGKRAAPTGGPTTFAERFTQTAPAEGDDDGRDSA